MKQFLVGESGCQKELVLGKEVINELLFHLSCLERTKQTEDQHWSAKQEGCSALKEHECSSVKGSP